MYSRPKKRRRMLDSVRARLTLWHVGILAFLLVTLSTGVYVVLRTNFYEKAGGILKSVCRATVSILDKELSLGAEDATAARATLETLNFPEYTLAILDTKNVLLAEKPSGQCRAWSCRIIRYAPTALWICIRYAPGSEIRTCGGWL